MSRATQRSMSSRPSSSGSRVQLHPKQGVAFFSTATEILYGGAAGGGKSARGGDLLISSRGLLSINMASSRSPCAILVWLEALRGRLHPDSEQFRSAPRT